MLRIVPHTVPRVGRSDKHFSDGFELHLLPLVQNIMESTLVRITTHAERESSLLTTYWSGTTDVFGGPSSRHGSLNSLFQVALYLPYYIYLTTHADLITTRRGAARAKDAQGTPTQSH